MFPSASNPAARSRGLSMLSLVAGFCSLLLVFNPPMGVFMASCALMAAYLSRTSGEKLQARSVIGTVLGILGLILNFVVFFNFLAVIRIMDDPSEVVKRIEDPQTAAQISEMLKQYRSIIHSLRHGR